MLAIEHAGRCSEGVADVAGAAPILRMADPVQQDEAVLDGWIASLTADQFERVLASLARGLGASSRREG